MISLKYANGLRNGANSDTHRCKQLTEHGEELCIKLREVAGFSACENSPNKAVTTDRNKT